jgi:tetratricopeptide (TPR) repeat protein
MTGSNPDTTGPVDSTGGGDKPDSGDGGPVAGGGDDGAGGGDDLGGGDGEPEPPPPPPKVEPPVKDMDEAEAKRLATGHVQSARAALTADKKDPDKAIESARQALSVDPNNLDAVVLMAHAYYFKKLYSTAEVILLRALDSPNKKISNQANASAEVFYVRGLVYDAQDQPEKAALAYEEAKKRDAKHKGTLLNLSAHYLRDSRYAEAEGMLETLMQLGINTPVLWNNLGTAYRGRSVSPSLNKATRDKLLTDAHTAYKRAIQLDKNYAPAYYNLGLLFMDASPFPMGGKDMDELKRLEAAKNEFENYRSMPGADINRVDEMIRKVDKAIKKEVRKRKKKESGDDDW